MESLRRLHQEAIELRDAPSISRELVDEWRTRARATFERVYGIDSQPVRDLARIRFDDSSVIDVAERILRQRAAESGGQLPPIRLPAEQVALRRGLSDAAELIRSLMV